MSQAVPNGRVPKGRGPGQSFQARLLGLEAAEPARLILRIRDGFEYSMLVKMCKEMKLTAREAVKLIQINKRTLDRRKMAGKFRPLESDRLARAARLFDLAEGLFEGDTGQARDWLRAPQRALGGSTPLEYASTEVGCREVEALIGRLENGVVA